MARPKSWGVRLAKLPKIQNLSDAVFISSGVTSRDLSLKTRYGLDLMRASVVSSAPPT
jgi:hypothetical protein